MGADGRAERLVGVSLDITDRMVADIRRRALVDLGDVIRDEQDPDDIAFAAARILGETLEVSRAGYGTVDLSAETITIERDWNAPGIRSLAGVLNFRDYGSYIDDLKRGETVVFANAELDPPDGGHGRRPQGDQRAIARQHAAHRTGWAGGAALPQPRDGAVLVGGRTRLRQGNSRANPCRGRASSCRTGTARSRGVAGAQSRGTNAGTRSCLEAVA